MSSDRLFFYGGDDYGGDALSFLCRMFTCISVPEGTGVVKYLEGNIICYVKKMLLLQMNANSVQLFLVYRGVHFDIHLP